MNKQLQSLMDKEMSRKEFVTTLGFGAATLMGFGSIMKFIRSQPATQHGSHKASAGYGSSPYGL